MRHASEATRSIAPVLVETRRTQSQDGTLVVKMSYRGTARYSGVESPNAISKTLVELTEIGWLNRLSKSALSSDLRRPVGEFLITPHSDELTENANHCYPQHRAESKAERDLRRRMIHRVSAGCANAQFCSRTVRKKDQRPRESMASTTRAY